MSIDVVEYRYKSLSASGVVVLHESDLTCETISSLGRWKTTTPYSAIEPHPIFLWQSPPLIVYSGVGLLVLTCIFALTAISELSSHTWKPSLTFAIYATFCVATFGLLVRVIRNWKAEWIIFPCSIDGHRVAYMKGQRNKTEFENFTANLTTRILAARQQLSEVR